MGGEGICTACRLPFVELDAYGNRLRGCTGCNQWQSLGSGEWGRLDDDDLAALRGMVARWTQAAKEQRDA
jgi:hypothetical protein